jgi:hypothetical protein
MGAKVHWWDPHSSLGQQTKLGCGRPYHKYEATRGPGNVTCAACLSSIDRLPELAKMAKVKLEGQVIGDFLEWLRQEKDWRLCEAHQHDDGCDGACNRGYELVGFSTEKLLAEFFEIDLDKVEQEKRAILDDMYQPKMKEE